MKRSDLNTITTRVSNGGMNKAAHLLLKQPRGRVLELRSSFTTAYAGRLRYSFEATLWNGPALRSGTTVCRYEKSLHLRGEHKLDPGDLVDLLLNAPPEAGTHFEALFAASKFSAAEFEAANRFPAHTLPEDEWSCVACNGPIVPLGVLGNRQHGRCRNCGFEANRTVRPLVEDLVSE